MDGVQAAFDTDIAPGHLDPRPDPLRQGPEADSVARSGARAHSEDSTRKDF